MRLNKVIYRVTSSDIHISERRFNCCSPIFARSKRQLSNIHISERQFYCCSPIFAISERLCPIFAISERLCPILTGKLKTEKQNNVQYSHKRKTVSDIRNKRKTVSDINREVKDRKTKQCPIFTRRERLCPIFIKMKDNKHKASNTRKKRKTLS